MNCPECGEAADGRSVVRTFTGEWERIRERRCPICGYRFKTRETVIVVGDDDDSLPAARRVAAGIKNLLDAEGL